MNGPPYQIIGIDPGNSETGYVELVEGEIGRSGILKNGDLVAEFGEEWTDGATFVVEMIGHYGSGMPAGREVFDTCIWIGRFTQVANDRFSTMYKLTRPKIKAHLCGSAKAKDGNVRQALIDRLGPQGTKKNPGPTYGMKSHLWSALAVAVTAYDLWDELEEVV